MLSVPIELVDLCLHRTDSAWLYALTIYALLGVTCIQDKMLLFLIPGSDP